MNNLRSIVLISLLSAITPAIAQDSTVLKVITMHKSRYDKLIITYINNTSDSLQITAKPLRNDIIKNYPCHIIDKYFSYRCYRIEAPLRTRSPINIILPRTTYRKIIKYKTDKTYTYIERIYSSKLKQGFLIEIPLHPFNQQSEGKSIIKPFYKTIKNFGDYPPERPPYP